MDQLEIGDLILYNSEHGIVCHLDPKIMICTNFHAYVPVQGPFHILQRRQNPECTIRHEIVERIRRYLSQTPG